MDSIVGPSEERGYYSTSEGTPHPVDVPGAQPQVPTITSMLKDAYHLQRMLAVIVSVVRDQVTVGYRFKVPPGGLMPPPDGMSADGACVGMSKQMRAALHSAHTRVINRMKKLVGQETLTSQAIRDLSELQTQQEGIDAVTRFVPGGSGNKLIRSEAAGIEIHFTDKVQVSDLLEAYNGAIEPLVTTALAAIQVQLTAAILRAERPAP